MRKKCTTDAQGSLDFSGKVCPKCKSDKAISDFCKDKQNKSGYACYCKSCQAAEHQRNREAKCEGFKRYYRENRERILAKCHERRPRANELKRKKYWLDPEKGLEPVRKRQQWRREHRGHWKIHDWHAVCASFGNKCLCCGRTDMPLTVDHIVPVSKGGSDELDNLQPLCKQCNCRKCDKIIDFRPAAGKES